MNNLLRLWLIVVFPLVISTSNKRIVSLFSLPNSPHSEHTKKNNKNTVEFIMQPFHEQTLLHFTLQIQFRAVFFSLFFSSVSSFFVPLLSNLLVCLLMWIFHKFATTIHALAKENIYYKRFMNNVRCFNSHYSDKSEKKITEYPIWVCFTPNTVPMKAHTVSWILYNRFWIWFDLDGIFFSFCESHFSIFQVEWSFFCSIDKTSNGNDELVFDSHLISNKMPNFVVDIKWRYFRNSVSSHSLDATSHNLNLGSIQHHSSWFYENLHLDFT